MTILAEPTSMQSLTNRILLIDDDQNLRKTLTAILRTKGYETVVAASGAEGLALLHGDSIHLALIDLDLPDLSGLEVLSRIKALRPDTEAIILTGNAALDSAIEATNRGAFTYMVKPYEIDQLLVHIRRALEKQQARKELTRSHERLKALFQQVETGNRELKATQAQMLQQEKMASIGQLAAGVAHEINNPLGFILSNLATLGKYGERLVGFIQAQSEALAALAEPGKGRELAELRGRLKLDHIIADMGQLIRESIDGGERVKKIVQDLKSFSRVDEEQWQSADINGCLESTLNIIWNELKYKAVVQREYGELPQVRCNPSQLNQVFMNLLVNAAHAIEKEGTITVRTWQGEEGVQVSVSDTGGGIPEEIRERIFEPFFTTKEVGKGTGLGLSISYDILKKHGGEIRVESEVGKGTTFTVSLPLTAG